MSLRGLDGVRLRGAEVEGDPLPEDVLMNSSSNVQISVLTVQQALAVAHRERIASTPSPGPIDGRWGPRTEAALTAFLEASENRLLIGDDPIEVYPRPGEAHDLLALPRQAVEHFRWLAEAYRPQNAPRDIPAGTPNGGLVPSGQQRAAIVPHKPMPWWAWLGIFLAGAAAIGVGYWYWRRNRRGG